MKPRHALSTIGLAIATWLAVFGNKASTADIAQPVVRPPSESAGHSLSSAQHPSASSPNRTPATGKARNDIVILALISREAPKSNPATGAAPQKGQASAAKQATGDLFAYHDWTPPPPPPSPAPPPTAPPLPFTYLGKKIQDGVWEAYLARGEHTYIAREQTVIDNAYRVDSIRPPTLSLTYLPLNQAQTIFIGGTD